MPIVTEPPSPAGSWVDFKTGTIARMGDEQHIPTEELFQNFLQHSALEANAQARPSSHGVLLSPERRRQPPPRPTIATPPPTHPPQDLRSELMPQGPQPAAPMEPRGYHPTALPAWDHSRLDRANQSVGEAASDSVQSVGQATAAMRSNSPGRSKPLKTVYVSDIPRDASEAELRSAFSSFGDVRMVNARHIHTGGFAFVFYEDGKSAEAAIYSKGTCVHGQEVSIMDKRPGT